MITVKDAGGNLIALKTTLVDGEHVPSQIVESFPLPQGASTDATLQQVLTVVQAHATVAQAQPVSIASGLPADPPTETTLQNVLTTQATEETLQDVLTAQATEASLQSILAKLVEILADLASKSDKTENQPVSVAVAGTLALNSTLASVLSAIETVGAEQVRRTDTLKTTPSIPVRPRVTIGPLNDTSPHELIAANASSATPLLQLTVSNTTAVDTWVVFLSATTEIYRVFAQAGSCREYEPSKWGALAGVINEAINTTCLTGSAGVYVTAVYI